MHVVWNGSDKARPQGPRKSSPLLYTRLNDPGTAFEVERNLMQRTFYLDGGGTVAADRQGNVYAVWHAFDETTKDESGRELWVAVSRDEGKTFTPERPALAEQTGACGCCGAKAFADSEGTVYVLYRGAKANVHRDMTLAASRDRGKTFRGVDIHPWTLDVCPMSSEGFVQSPQGVVAAWETRDHVYWGRVDPGTFGVPRPVAAPWNGSGQKHPALATNSRGEILLAWTEGAGWAKGGDLVWQVYDVQGKPTSEKGRRKGAVPVWGLAAPFASKDGRFTILY